MAKKVSKTEFKHTMSKRMVNVSQTKFDSGSKRVTGPKGKLFTGAVDMGGGRTQVYEKGRRLKISDKMKGFRNPPSSNGSAKTSSSTPVVETTTLPKVTGGDALSRSLGAGRKVSSTSGTSSSAAPSSLQKTASGAKTTGRPSPGPAAAKARKTSSYQAAQKKVTRQKTAAKRQSGVKLGVAVGTNPVNYGIGTVFGVSNRIRKNIASTAQNWWEGK